MAYEHGITITENPTSVTPPVTTSAGVQVVIGTAPVNLIADPASAVNKPILANNWDEAVNQLGYSDDFDKYTLCQSMFASFQLLGVAPVVFINVLDPAVHKESVAEAPYPLVKGNCLIDDTGILLNSVIVKSNDGVTTYENDVDYTLAFNEDGKPIISVTTATTIPTNTTSLKAAFDKLDPSKVTKADIIGGYDADNNKSSGAELIRQVFPMFGLIPGIILAPGWSHIPDVGLILTAKSENINGNFNCENVLDIDSGVVKKYQDVEAWKDTNSYTDKRSTILWPKVKVGEKILFYSAIMAAIMAYTDSQNDDVPFVSPSNKSIPITGTVLADGTDVYLDQLQANYLNGIGVVTALNWNGWRTWGNNTAAYPGTSDPKDRFIAIRRVFDWWGNTFIQTFFDKVDDPTNYRLIESVVDSENLRANGYQAKEQIAGASIEFREDLNPLSNILDGKITFIQKIAAFPPAEKIENVLEFDPNMLSSAINGGA